MEERHRNLRDFFLLVYGVFLGIIGNILVESIILEYPPIVILSWFFILVVYFISAGFFLWIIELKKSK